MFVCSLGLQNSPSGSTPSTPAGFGGVTPFYNRTLIPLALRKHKGNPQNNQTGTGKSLQPFQKPSPISRSKSGSLLMQLSLSAGFPSCHPSLYRGSVANFNMMVDSASSFYPHSLIFPGSRQREVGRLCPREVGVSYSSSSAK